MHCTDMKPVFAIYGPLVYIRCFLHRGLTGSMVVALSIKTFKLYFYLTITAYFKVIVL